MAVTLRKGSGDWSSATHLLKADVEEFALGLTIATPRLCVNGSARRITKYLTLSKPTRALGLFICSFVLALDYESAVALLHLS